MTKDEFHEYYGEDPEEALGANWKTIIRGLDPGDNIPGFPPRNKPEREND